MSECVFCQRESLQVHHESVLFLAVRDRYPISPGHTLLIPKRHVVSFFALGQDEQQDFLSLLQTVKEDLDRTHDPDGYNLGVNDGEAAGQTVMHLHVHVIPRYRGDRDDPRGGVRWLMPHKAVYWQDG